MFRRFLKSDFVRRIACFLAANYIRLVYLTSRFELVRADIPARYWDEGKPFILAFWHGRIAMMPYCWRKGAAMNMLISRHRDGELIANTIAYFGLKSVRGSAARPGSAKERGGQAALIAMLRCLRAGECVGITPDGPRGPRMRASEGAIALAALSGAPVIPCAFATRARRVMRSWDGFIVPFPFTKGAFVWGNPLHVSHETFPEEFEKARQALENGLNGVTFEADSRVGRSAVEPAPIPTVGAEGA